MYDIIIIGSGISAFSFLKGLNQKGKKIGMISYEGNSKSKIKHHNLIDRNNLPPRMKVNQKNLNNINDFFEKNNFKVMKNTSIFGLLAHGGVSNYWGCSNEEFIFNDLSFLNKKNKVILKDAFNFFKSKYYIEKIKKNHDNSINKKKYINIKNKLFTDKSKIFNFYKNSVAYNEKRKLEFIPKNYNKEISKKIKLYNYFVNKIRKKKNYYEMHCTNKNGNLILRSKKVVLAAGTLSTTRIVCEMLNFKEKIKVMHNPMLFGVFISKYSIKENENKLLPSDMAAKIKDKSFNTILTANFRRSNKIIENKIYQNFKIAKNFIFKKLYNNFKLKLLFTNLYLDNKYSNIFFKFDGKNFKIFSETNYKKRNNKILKSNFRKIYKYLKHKNIISFLNYFYIPETGTDNHFTGTIPISKKKKLSLNENCELKNHKDFYIVDGSCIPQINLKFPTNLIICNAYRIGKLIK